MTIRRESAQSPGATGSQSREGLRHTRSVYRRAERRDFPSQPRIRAYIRSFMN